MRATPFQAELERRRIARLDPFKHVTWEGPTSRRKEGLAWMRAPRLVDRAPEKATKE